MQEFIHKGHWYNNSNDLCTPLDPTAVPSVTTILSIIANPGLEAWRLHVGPVEASERSRVASENGTNVHKALEDTVNGKHREDNSYADEIKAFNQWREEYQPTNLEAETFLRSTKYKFAGKTDLICWIGGELWIVDFKTSKSIRTEYGLQLRGYEQAYFELHGKHARMAVLQITNKIKAGYRFKELDEPLDVFLACKELFDWTRQYTAEVYDGRFIRTA